MDGDMQDPPSLIVDMLRKVEDTDAQVVYAVRKNRDADTFSRKYQQKFFINFSII